MFLINTPKNKKEPIKKIPSNNTKMYIFKLEIFLRDLYGVNTLLLGFLLDGMLFR
jgi:hypothetical protein